VPGLRRSEVADLAGVSVEYYAQLECGNLAGVSESVLDALGRALQLSEAEREHLLDLARAAGPARRRPPARQVRPSVARVLDGMTEVPGTLRLGWTCPAPGPYVLPSGDNSVAAPDPGSGRTYFLVVN
jgi:hypothetical protein